MPDGKLHRYSSTLFKKRCKMHRSHQCHIRQQDDADCPGHLRQYIGAAQLQTILTNEANEKDQHDEQEMENNETEEEKSNEDESDSAGCIEFPETTQPSLHSMKKQTEISENAPQVRVNCLATLFLQPKKFGDTALLPFIHQFVLTSCR
jgi:hypothetical protein